MPQANSTTSRPRDTSPAASETTLPCSEEMSRASSSRCRATSSRNANSTFVRCESEVSRQPGNASFAAATAASTSGRPARSTAPARRPVAGS